MLLELQELNKKLDLLEAGNTKLQKKTIDVDLVGGKFLLYAYECTNRVKFGTNFRNKADQRPKSHRMSIPNYIQYRFCYLRI
jgi:hypothetical protein